MITRFIDRQSGSPNRFKVIPESGEPYYVVLERADDVITPGTPLNADTFNNMLTRAACVREQKNNTDVTFWLGTQEEYDALSEKPNNCLCIITDDQERADFVVEQGETVVDGDTWRYRKWNSGFVECWLRSYVQKAVTEACGNGMYKTDLMIHQLPVGMFTKVRYANVTVSEWDTQGLPHAEVVQAAVNGQTQRAQIQWFLYRTATSDLYGFNFAVEINGEWK